MAFELLQRFLLNTSADIVSKVARHRKRFTFLFIGNNKSERDFCIGIWSMSMKLKCQSRKSDMCKGDLKEKYLI